MAVQEEEILERVKKILERAADDPDFEDRLLADPWGTAEAEGLSRDATIEALSLSREASDEQIAESLKQRISRSAWAGAVPDYDVVP